MLKRNGWMVLLLGISAAVAAAEIRRGTVTVRCDLSARPPGEEARLWLPYPVSDKEQAITAVKVVGDYAESAVYTDRTHGVPMLFARWAKGAPSRKLALSFSVERREVAARSLPEREGTWNPADYAPSLGPTRLGPVSGKVKALADEITQGKNTIPAKARAIYDWVCLHMHRDPKTVGCGAGDVAALLETPGGKCADIHSVFVALLRAAGIPARETFGLRLGTEDAQDITTWQHCWAEFFLPSYGWVACDPADVLKLMLTERLGASDPKVAAARPALPALPCSGEPGSEWV